MADSKRPLATDTFPGCNRIGARHHGNTTNTEAEMVVAREDLTEHIVSRGQSLKVNNY